MRILSALIVLVSLTLPATAQQKIGIKPETRTVYVFPPNTPGYQWVLQPDGFYKEQAMAVSVDACASATYTYTYTVGADACATSTTATRARGLFRGGLFRGRGAAACK